MTTQDTMNLPRLLVIAALLAPLAARATTESHPTKPRQPTESPAPANKTPAASLSSRDVFKRIAEQTGGLYRFKTQPSSEDYQKFLHDALDKPADNK